MRNKILSALVFAVGCNWLGVADAAYVIKLKNGKLPGSAPGLSRYHVKVRNGDEIGQKRGTWVNSASCRTG